MIQKGSDGLPEGPRGQMLAVALALVAAAFLWLAVASPLIGWYTARSDDLAASRILLEHMAARARDLPALRRLAAASQAGAAPSASLLGGDSDAIAAATLQGEIQDMATAAGATLTSTEALPGVQQGGFRQIALRIALSGRWPVLIALLQAIDASDLRLLVDDLEFHAVADAGPQSPGATGHAPLEASFVVLALRLAAGRADDLHAQADPQP
ncbi:type II secretion system protein GspM [Acidisoma cladoniae]|jgi:hypothetical protein|uniref:type II secretion system protein GspM n=1 Tax=Acidisoma cladoniae TaxID=3040935 RepID=UPI00254A9B0C|nr:type II secretion system protein GspM [Acidisoma sp. PAMC 29798]